MQMDVVVMKQQIAQVNVVDQQSLMNEVYVMVVVLIYHVGMVVLYVKNRNVLINQKIILFGIQILMEY